MLSTRWLMLTLLATLLLSDRVVGALFVRPPQLMPLVEKYRETRKGAHVVVFGTCLGDAMVPAVVEGEWEGQVHNLSMRGSTALEWYLILSRYIEDDPGLKAIVVVVGGNDLELKSSPWESQVLDLAGWEDLPALAQDGCSSAGCAIELLARKLSYTYRIRPFIALGLWHAAGTDMPGIPKAPINGQKALINEDHPSLPIERQGGGGGLVPSQLQAPPGGTPGPGPGQNPGPYGGPTGGGPRGQNPGLSDGNQKSSSSYGGQNGPEAAWSAQQESNWFEKDASFWAKKLIEEAQRRGIRVAFLPLPSNPQWPAKDWRAARQLVEGQGAQWWEPGHVEGLGPSDFLDDVHFNKPGLNKVARRLGQLLQQRL